MGKSMYLIIIGVILILLGTATWVYGDSKYNYTYIWSGVAAILIGTVVWIIGDYIGGAFSMKGKK